MNEAVYSLGPRKLIYNISSITVTITGIGSLALIKVSPLALCNIVGQGQDTWALEVGYHGTTEVC